MTGAEILKTYDPKKLVSCSNDWRSLLLAWHPDINHDPEATKVSAHLMELRAAYKENRVLASPDRETILISGGKIIFDTEIILQSKLNSHYSQKALEVLRAKDPQLHNRLPTIKSVADDEVTFARYDDSISMTELIKNWEKLPVHHVVWMTNRLLELIAIMHMHGYMHGGITPENLLILLDKHGVIPHDFRFVKPLGHKLEYLPDQLVHLAGDKTASQLIDIGSVCRTAFILLGDPGGTGNRLLKDKTIPKTLFDHLRNPKGASKEFYTKHKEILLKEFGPPKYFVLTRSK